ncbi:helix-turn-helix transcriptional regulator [Microbacterium tumbae]
MAPTSSRMLTLLSLLQSRRDWPGRVLADRLGVSARTVRRDIDRLRELGYRISAMKGPDGGYRMSAGSELPPLLFDDDQAVAIAVALQTIPSSGIDVREGAERALATVRQVMPSRLRHRVDGIRFSDTANDARADAAVLESVSGAVRERQVLRFDYGSADGPARRAEPHAIVARRGRWYLIAWDLERGAWRFFRLDRLHPRVPHGPSFTPRTLPSPDAQTFLAARTKGSDAEDRWPCVGEILLELPLSQVAPWIDEDSVTEVSERVCRVHVGSWSWIGVLASVARFDAPFTIVGPAALSDAATGLAQRLMTAGGAEELASRP